MAELKVTIGADSSEVDKEISKLEKDLKKLESQKQTNIKLGVDTNTLDRSINSTKSKLDSLKTSMAATSQATAKFQQATANGGNTLMQFSRIAQDAPFGIMGIGNNITATAEAFGNLSKSSGGAGNALKAVASSMLGTGGILLAVSLVTTGLTYMAQNGITVGDVFDKLTGKFDKVGKAMNEAFAEAAKNSSTEITSFKALANVAQDVNTSMEKRLLAVNKLQKEYPAYFGNLSKEQILNGDVSTATKDLTQAIIAKAKAQAFSNRIAELAEASLKNDLEAIKLRKELIKLETIAAQAANNNAAAQFGGTSAYVSGVKSATDAVENQKQKIYELVKANQENARIMQIYTNEVNKATDASILLEAPTPKAAKDGKTKGRIIPFKSYLEPITPDQLKPFNNAINEAVNVQLPATVPVKLNEGLLRMQESLINFNNAANEIITSGISNTFIGLGEAIGDAMATGGNILNAAGDALLASMGTVLSQLGQLAIQTGVGLLAVKKALETLNPYVAIAAGVALVAIGAAFKGKTKKIGGSMGSSGSSSNISSGRDYTSPSSSVNTGGSGFSSGTVVFEISGQSLIGVLSNTLDKNSRLGGALGI